MSVYRPRVIAGRYELRRTIGEGSFSITWRATDNVLGRDVAVKILREQYANDPTFSSRFENEARAAAAISHPNVVPVFDFGRDGGTSFIVMQYVPGPTLKDYIREEGRLPIDEAISFTRQILEGLAAIHDAGIIHRDIKPQNVLLTDTFQAKLTDFGIARSAIDSNLTGTGNAIGTAAYMAPEQAAGDGVSPSADLYSVGVILYEMLTGRLPFPGENPVQVMYRHVNELPPPPRSLNRQIPLTLEAFILRALSKNPDDRYPDARIMRDALLDPTSEPRLGSRRPRPAIDPDQATAVARNVAGTAAVAGGAPSGVFPTRAAAPPRVPTHPPVRRVARGSDARRGTWVVLVPLLLVLALVGGVAAYALTGQMADRDPHATATIPAVAATDTGAPSPAATDEPTQQPTTAVEPASPTSVAATATAQAPTATSTATATVASPTATMTATATRTATATATPAPPTATPAPPTATPPPPVPFNTPIPIDGLPASIVQGPAAAFGADAFAGAYRRPDGELYGRPAAHLYGPGSGNDVATVTFAVDEAPQNYILIALTGMDDELAKKVRMRVSLNGHVVWEGDSPFANEQWTERGWLVGDLTWLQPGDNTLVIENIANGDNAAVGNPPWLLFTEGVVYYG